MNIKRPAAFLTFSAILVVAIAAFRIFSPPAPTSAAPETIPILVAAVEGGKKEIRVGVWNLSANEIVTQDKPIDFTTDLFMLHSLHWDGNTKIYRPDWYLKNDVIYFSEDMEVTPFLLEGAVFYRDTTVSRSDTNEYFIQRGNDPLPLEVKLNLDEPGLNTEYPDLLSLIVKDDTAYLLQMPGVFGPEGLPIFCSTINLKDAESTTQLVNGAPLEWDNIVMELLSPDTFGTDGEQFFLFTKQGVVSIDPITGTTKLLIPSAKLPQSGSKNGGESIYSALWVSSEYLVLEVSNFKGDILVDRDYHAFTTDGEHLATHHSEFSSYYAFPKN